MGKRKGGSGNKVERRRGGEAERRGEEGVYWEMGWHGMGKDGYESGRWGGGGGGRGGGGGGRRGGEGTEGYEEEKGGNEFRWVDR